MAKDLLFTGEVDVNSNKIINVDLCTNGTDAANKNYVDSFVAGGTSGYSGTSGFSGADGFSGSNGASGTSGYSGANPGTSGYSGTSGASGYSGLSGFSGESGYSGISGYSGTSGFSGGVGQSGYSGISGYSGTSGSIGTSGYSGYSGAITQQVNQVAHGLSVGDVIRSSGGANAYTKAKADSAANAEVVGVVTVVLGPDDFIFTQYGYAVTGVPAQAAGTVMFLSAATAGLMTTTEPSTAGQVSKPIAIVEENAAKMEVVNMRGQLIATIPGSTTIIYDPLAAIGNGAVGGPGLSQAHAKIVSANTLADGDIIRVRSIFTCTVSGSGNDFLGNPAYHTYFSFGDVSANNHILIGETIIYELEMNRRSSNTSFYTLAVWVNSTVTRTSGTSANDWSSTVTANCVIGVNNSTANEVLNEQLLIVRTQI